MILIDWLCNTRDMLDFKLYPIADGLYIDDNYDYNIYMYLKYYDVMVNLQTADLFSAMYIADNLTTNIWHVVAQMEYLDWKDLRKNEEDFFFNTLKHIHIREEYEEKNSNVSWLLLEFKGKYYGEFEKGVTTKNRSNLIYLSSDYRTSKYMYEEYLALKGAKWKNEWNY